MQDDDVLIIIIIMSGLFLFLWTLFKLTVGYFYY